MHYHPIPDTRQLFKQYDQQAEIDDLKRQLEQKAEESYLNQQAAEAWDRFLDRHQRELEDLRRLSKQQKAENAELNRKLGKAKRTEDSLRFEIDHLRSTESREIRQAHQEAIQWQKRYEDAQYRIKVLEDDVRRFKRLYNDTLDSLIQSKSDLTLVIDVIKNVVGYVEQPQEDQSEELEQASLGEFSPSMERVYSATFHADGTKTVHVNTLGVDGYRERS